tara:strand:- start:447 stop:662 length:216 start_codon:yes stop_codon:yes gene_type:complete
MAYGIATKCYHYHKERNIIMDNDNENNIDINQYIEYDEGNNMRVYFKREQFLEDALEYLQNEHQDYEIVEV